jgi:hypothetical protein
MEQLALETESVVMLLTTFAILFIDRAYNSGIKLF